MTILQTNDVLIEDLVRGSYGVWFTIPVHLSGTSRNNRFPFHQRFQMGLSEKKLPRYPRIPLLSINFPIRLAKQYCIYGVYLISGQSPRVKIWCFTIPQLHPDINRFSTCPGEITDFYLFQSDDLLVFCSQSRRQLPHRHWKPGDFVRTTVCISVLKKNAYIA